MRFEFGGKSTERGRDSARLVSHALFWSKAASLPALWVEVFVYKFTLLWHPGVLPPHRKVLLRNQERLNWKENRSVGWMCSGRKAQLVTSARELEEGLCHTVRRRRTWWYHTQTNERCHTNEALSFPPHCAAACSGSDGPSHQTECRGKHTVFCTCLHQTAKPHPALPCLHVWH